MENQEHNKKSFRISTNGYSYGKWLLVFVLFSGINNSIQQGIKPHSLSAAMAVFTIAITYILDIGALYFLTLWIIDLIRRRGKIDRPENKKAKMIVNVIFGIIFLLMAGSVVMSMSGDSSQKISSEQSSFINTLNEKFKEFTVESDGVKFAAQSLMETVNNKEWSKMNGVFKDLLSATQALQPKIDEVKKFSQQGVNLSNNSKEQAVFDLYLKAIDLRDQDNKKLTELASFGLTIDWENPTEAQLTKWGKLVEELSVIENEIKNTQTALQNTLEDNNS